MLGGGVDVGRLHYTAIPLMIWSLNYDALTRMSWA